MEPVERLCNGIIYCRKRPADIMTCFQIIFRPAITRGIIRELEKFGLKCLGSRSVEVGDRAYSFPIQKSNPRARMRR